MRILIVVLQLILLIGLATVPPRIDADETEPQSEDGPPAVVPQPLPDGFIERFHFVPMRDGVRLWTSMRLPDGSHEPLPTILIRTPYTFDMEAQAAFQNHFLEQGYAFVLQHERGRYWSEGDYSIIANGAEDGYDTVDWIARQSWSNGKVGTIGCSSSGDTQVLLAKADHPAHAAAITMSSGSATGFVGPFHDLGLFFRGGVIQMPWAVWYASAGQRWFPKFPANADAEAREWLATRFEYPNQGNREIDAEAIANGLPITDAVAISGAMPTDYDDFVNRHLNDPHWQEENFWNEGDPFGVPALWVFQIHDIGLDSNMATFEHVVSRAGEPGVDPNQKTIVSALDHCSMGRETQETIDGERPVGDARFDYLSVYQDWFDYWLKGEDNDALQRPQAEIYVPGKNVWQQFESWPPESRSETVYYLSSEGMANSRRESDGKLQPRPQTHATANTYLYDPFSPAPSVGGDVCCAGESTIAGSFDYSKIDDRDDVLVYTSEPLDDDLTVLGFVDVVLHVSSDAADTDFVAKIFDVYPDGRAFILKDTIQRARWRDGYIEPRFMEAGEVYELRVGPMFVSNQFNRGHRIRIEVTSSNFPRYFRNLNTGGNNFDETQGRTALNSVHMSETHPSRVVLPTVNRQ